MGKALMKSIYFNSWLHIWDCISEELGISNWFAGILLFFLMAVPLAAQNTNLTATLQDSTGQTWYSGSYSILFVPTPGKTGAFYWQGSVFAPQKYQGNLNGSGVLSVTLPDNNTITPSGSMWQFSLCPNATAQCTIVTTPVTGASEDLSAQFSNDLISPQVFAAPMPRAYSSAEVPIPPPLQGGQFYQVVNNLPYFWTGTYWKALAGSGTVNNGTIGQLAYYATASNIVSGENTASISQGGTGASTAIGAINNIINGNALDPSSVATQLKPVIDVTNPVYGAVGDGNLVANTGTNNGAKIQSAINVAQALGAEVFVPCGVYQIGTPLTDYGATAALIIGPAQGCVIIHYNGPSTPWGMLTVALQAPATPCTSASCNLTTGQPAPIGFACCSAGFHSEGITWLGSANTPDAVDLLLAVGIDIRNENMLGSGTSSFFCMSCGGANLTNVNVSYNSIYFTPGGTGFTPNSQPNGFVFDGYIPGGESLANLVHLDTPGANNLTGKAIWVRNGTLLTFSNCQLSGNTVNLQLDGVDGGVTVNDGCLSEGGGYGGALNIGSAAVQVSLDRMSSSGALTVSGVGTVIKNSSINNLTLGSTASNTHIEDTEIVGASSVITCNETDASWDNLWYAATGQPFANFPGSRTVPPGAIGVAGGTVDLGHGAWYTSGTAQALDPCPLPVVNSTWSVVFDGWWLDSSGVIAAPQHLVLTDFSPSFKPPSGGTATVSVSSNHLYLAGTGLAGNLSFFGDIQYIPGSYAMSGSNANGYWVKDPTGHIHQWGHISGETTNCNEIAFPVAFTTLASITPTVSDDFSTGSSIEHSIVINAAHGCTGLSTTAMYDWVSSTGGNGAWWTADGY
jgi:hypothetical protein